MDSLHPLVLRIAVASLVASTALVAQSPPLVVAVDTSRSLRAEDVDRASRLLEAAVGDLAGGTGALMVFDDEPVWIASLGTPLERVAAQVADLSPRGDHTLLYDALFVAARELHEGGVIVVVSDGRDENSATTVEDVAGLCRELGVRILTVGSGRRLEARSLRRLALLTDGAYLGELGADLPPSRLSGAIREAMTTVPAEEPTQAPAIEESLPPSAQPEPSPPLAVSEPVPTEESGVLPWLVGLALAIVFGGAVVGAVLRHRRGEAPSCPVCGDPLEEVDADCERCLADELHSRLRQIPVASLEDTAEFDLPLDDGQPSEPASLEKTRVLSDQHVLVVQEPGERPRNYLLRQHAAFGVGRVPDGNTIALADPSLSANHFRIVPEDGWFFVLDLGSTNGTYVNQERVVAKRLRSGDVIHAGQADLELRSYTRPLY